VTLPRFQYRLLTALLLTAVSAYWLWMLRDLGPTVVSVLAALTLTAAILGHLIFTYLLPSRLTVLVTNIVFSTAILVALALLEGSGSGIGEIPMIIFMLHKAPVDFLLHTRDVVETLSAVLMIASPILLALAHSLRPSWPAALIAAAGTSLWYGIALLIVQGAG